ncbi:MAG: protein O-mannosyl-transferase family [bacterium]
MKPIPKKIFLTWISGSLFFLALWALLLRAENPDLMADDSGEMIAGSWALGLPHPPGYPLFDLVGHVFSWIPLGSVAFRYNLLSGLLALGAVLITGGTVQLLARRIGLVEPLYPGWVAPMMGYSAGVVLFFHRSLFAEALSAKGVVYTGSLLLAAWLAWHRVKKNEERLSEKEVFFLFFLWAVGLTNHWETVILFSPFLAYWIWTSRWSLSPKRLAWMAMSVALGLTPYLYLPLRANLNPLPCWGNPVSLREFLWVATRKLVAGSESFFHGLPGYVNSILQLIDSLHQDWFPFFAVWVVLGLVFIFRGRLVWGFSLLVLYLPVWVAVMAVQEKESIDYLLNVFLVSVSGLWVLFGFWGGMVLIRKFFRPRYRLIWGLAVVLVLGVLSLWSFRVFQLESKSGYTLAGDFGINALRQIPRDGLLVAGGDAFVMPFFYDQFVLGLRPDVLFTPDVFLAHNWGWKQIENQRPAWRMDWNAEKTLGQRWQWLVARADREGGAYYALGARYLDSVLNSSPGQWIPDGLAFQWVNPNARAKVDSNRLLSQMDGERRRGPIWTDHRGKLDFASEQITRYYGDQYFQAARFIRRKGDAPKRLVFLDRSLEIYPFNADACNVLAQLLDQEGNWEMAIEVLRQGVRARPSLIPLWFNLTRLYQREGNWAKANFCWTQLMSRGWKANGAFRGLRESHKRRAVGRGPRSAEKLFLQARVYQKHGLSFLAEKALETSRNLLRDPTGMSL